MRKHRVNGGNFLVQVHEKLAEKKVRFRVGVLGFGWKFASVFLLYTAAFVLMSQDPWYGSRNFAWNQGVFVLLISFFIVTTLSFDWKLMGPTKSLNCMLSIYLIVPFSFFIGRIIGKPRYTDSSSSLIDAAIESGKGVLGSIGFTSMIPKWIQEVFSSPGIAVLLLGVCAALSAKNKTAQKGLLLTTLLIPFFGAFAYEPGISFHFFSGMVLMFAGMQFQFMDMDKYHSDAVLVSTFNNVRDIAERKSCIRIMEYVRKHGRVTDKTLYAIARRCFQEEHQVDAMHVPEITLALAQRLVAEHGLLVMQNTNEGQYFVLNTRLFSQNDTLGEIVRWPRNVIIGIIAFVWLLSPIDFIPDTMPGGTIDDALIAFFGFSPFVRQIANATRNSEGVPHYLSNG